jgi:hypothetical protein
VQKFVSKYAAAAHLALLAVAPLFLFPFFSDGTVAVVQIWASGVAAVWVLMEPSRRRGEMAHAARLRVAHAVFTDPFFWFLAAAVLFSWVRHVNGGIAMSYNAEEMKWSLSAPTMPLLPGSVTGTGLLPFSGVVSALVLLMGARHALGRSARLAFFAAASVFAGLAAAMSAFLLSYGYAPIVKLAACGYQTPSFPGAAYGILLLGAVAAVFACAEMKWRQVEPLVGLGAVCTAIAFILFSPPATIAVVTAAFALQVVLSFALKGRYLDGSGSLRCALTVLCMGAAAGSLLFLAAPASAVGVKREAFLALSVFPEKFMEMRAALSQIALDVWKEGPWLGSGLGSFPFDIRFKATAQVWALIPPSQTAVPSGWWFLIAERGIVGAVLLAVALGFLLWTYFSRMVRSFGHFRWQPANTLLPVLLAAFTALSFVDYSFLRADTLPLLAVFLALSANTFPLRRKEMPGA